ncbi:FAD-binding oxidoreductase [Brachybacterium tyrofermentans]|uniref:FAD-binding oxidoreductase n=1 Tax=Brachybacterium tyrofermentans TaxID=47848 RepID=UPI003FD4D925
MSILSHTALASLPHVVRGPVWLPGDPGFEQARRPWNLAIAQDVSAVVEAADAVDVAELVRFASAHSLSVATQPSGHGATGRADGSILLRTSRLDTLEVDPGTRTARIGAGVRSGELQRVLAPHGLTALPGSSPVVTVTGAALGGGLSWFGRAFGWMADSILSAEVITADGAAHTVAPQSDPELLWALGGGGGDLAIVTSLELRVHPAPSVVGGRQLWSAVHALEVALTYRALTEVAPPELTLWLELLSFPGAEPMIAIDSTFLGEEDQARWLLQATELLPAPLADTRTTLDVAELGRITGEPTDPGPGQSRGELLTGLDDGALSTLLDRPIAPLMTVQLRHLGGAFAQNTDNPHGALEEPYAAYLFGVPSSPEVAAGIRDRQAELAASLPVSGRKPISFLSPTETLAAALPDTSMQRLRRLKEERDPQQTLRGNFSILG